MAKGWVREELPRARSPGPPHPPKPFCCSPLTAWCPAAPCPWAPWSGSPGVAEPGRWWRFDIHATCRGSGGPWAVGTPWGLAGAKSRGAEGSFGARARLQRCLFCEGVALCLPCPLALLMGEPLLGVFAVGESCEGADGSSWGCKAAFWVAGGLSWNLVPAREVSVSVSPAELCRARILHRFEVKDFKNCPDP